MFVSLTLSMSFFVEFQFYLECESILNINFQQEQKILLSEVKTMNSNSHHINLTFSNHAKLRSNTTSKMIRRFSKLPRFSVNKNVQVSSFFQVSEFDQPTDIITHCPSLAERFPFHLDAFLYQSPPNPSMAAKCHRQFCDLLHKETGARVWTVREILSQLSSAQLRDLVIRSSDCKFQVSAGVDTKSDPNLQRMMNRDYFDYSLSKLNKDHLIDLLMLHPSVTIKVDHSSTGFSVTEIPVSPLSNFIFTRDQQITTANGVVIGRFAKEQRSFENDLMLTVWKQLGINPIGRLQNPALLEGGDFFPLSPDLSMLGVGLRTNFEAARQLMKDDLVGTNRFVVVEDVRDRSQNRTHLDTVFTPIDNNFCICLDLVAQDDPRFLRIAREFVKRGGAYVEEVQMPFGKWLRNEGYTVVMATLTQQQQYFLNNLHLGRDNNGKGKILSINPEVEKSLKKHGFDGTVLYMDFSPITSMYGGVHCSTQVLRAHQ